MNPQDRRSFLQQAAGAAAAFAFRPTLEPLGDIAPNGRAELGVAVVGTGRQGRAILAELQKIEGVRIEAVCDVIPGRLRSGLRRARGATGYEDHRKMLDEAEGVDAVVVASSTHAHEAAAVDAVAAGKHVYCEAPLAMTIEGARAIATAAKGSGKVFQSGLLARSNPIYKLAWSFHRAGVLEELMSLRAQDHAKTSWRLPAPDPELARMLDWRLDPERSAGLPGELGTHQLDVIQWFVGSYPSRVHGRGMVRLYDDGRTMPDTVQCTFEFGDGLLLHWSGTLGSSYEGRYELITGAMGTMRLAWDAGWLFKEADAPTQGWEVYANRERFHDDSGITLIADATKLAKQGKLAEGVSLPNPAVYYGLVDFVKSCTESTEITSTAEAGFRATVVGIAAQHAVLSGESVDIDSDDLTV